MAAEASTSNIGSIDESELNHQPYAFLEDGALMPGSDKVLIAVMGVTGSGKSQFINTLKATRITRDEHKARQGDERYAKIGKTLASQTKHIEFFHLIVDNHDIILVDTPGFNGKDRSDTETLTDLAAWLADMFVKERLLSGICYMHRMNETRFNGTANENMIMLYKLCGPDGIANVKLVTSMWDKSRGNNEIEAEFIAREQQLKELYWSELLKDGASTMRSFNDSKSVLACVRSIISNIRKSLALQNQIVVERRPLALTDIGKRIMEYARQSELELTFKLAELEKIEWRLHLERETLSRPLIMQKEKLRQARAEVECQQKALEDWTWKDAITAFALTTMIGGVAGGVGWYKGWKREKDEMAKKLKESELLIVAHTIEAQSAEIKASRVAERNLIELFNHYEERMRLANDVLIEKWFTRMPKDPRSLKAALKRTLPPNSLGFNQHLVVCGWEFPSFCQDLILLNSKPSKELLKSAIEQTVAIVGSDPYFQTTTIKSYLEMKWGEKGNQILQIAIETTYDSMNKNKQSKLPFAGTWPSDLLYLSPLRLYVYHGHVILQLSTDNEGYDTLKGSNESIQALLWLCQATRLQRGDSRLLGMSSRLEELVTDSGGRSKPERVSFYPLKRMEEVDSEMPGFCWASLFKKVVVIEAEVDREWKEAIGLELSYELMVKLAAVETIVEVTAEDSDELQLDDHNPWTESLVQDSTYHVDQSNLGNAEQGFVLAGYFTALVPIRHHNDTIQWHLEHMDPVGKDTTTINPKALKSTATRNSWFQTQDLALLRSQKCILGWWNKANVMLGTQLLPNDVRFGRRDSVRKWTSHMKGISLTLQIGVSSPIPINASTTIEFERISNIQRFDPTTLYLAALDRMSLETALIYDTSSNQAWLVPKLSLLLHMCHSYVGTYQDPSMDSIPFVEPSANPSADIKAALKLAADRPVDTNGDGTYPLSALLVSLNASLINSTLTEESNTRTLFRSNRLLARQYMDLIQEPSRGASLTVINVPESFKAWQGIIDAVDSILICANLGLAIQPTISISCACTSIPEGQGFLIAHSWCLQRILARQGKGEDLTSLMTTSVFMTQDCLWELQGNAIPECTNNFHTPLWEDLKAPLQKISRATRRGFFTASQDAELKDLRQTPCIEGAVVFGSHRNKIQKVRGRDQI